MNSKFLIIKDYNLSIERFKDDIGLADMLQSLDEELQHPDYPYVKRILVDLRGCSFNHKDVCIANALQLGNRYSAIKNFFSLVYLTNSPVETAFSTLCVNHIEIANGFFDVCCTIKGALKILGLEICPNHFEKLIDDV